MNDENKARAAADPSSHESAVMQMMFQAFRCLLPLLEHDARMMSRAIAAISGTAEPLKYHPPHGVDQACDGESKDVDDMKEERCRRRRLVTRNLMAE
jgi:hypothetical protein